MKHEWKKSEKAIYLPKTEPTVIEIPSYKYFTLSGHGDPNEQAFADAVSVLYALSYAVKMMPKKEGAPLGYFDYSIYPLEGIWEASEEIKAGTRLDKSKLSYKIMMRQPDFVTDEVWLRALEKVKRSKPHPLLDGVRFESIKDGSCVQMLHVGSYDDEPRSFEMMNAFCAKHGLVRKSLNHREIYLTDARKTAPERLKTVLRYFL